MSATKPLLIVGGLSGSGKTSIIRGLTTYFGSRFRRVVTSTTRPPRVGEKDGVDYLFLTGDEFQANIDRGNFLEYATVFGYRYGTLRSAVDDAFYGNGHIPVLNVDCQGLESIKADPCLGPRVLSVFITAHTCILKERLRVRAECDGTSVEALDERLTQAHDGIGLRWSYNRTVVNNGSLGKAVMRVVEIVDERLGLQRLKSVLDRV